MRAYPPVTGLSIKFFHINSKDVQLRALQGLIHGFCVLVRVNHTDVEQPMVLYRILNLGGVEV
jgi:hypothetical protein